MSPFLIADMIGLIDLFIEHRSDDKEAMQSASDLLRHIAEDIHDRQEAIQRKLDAIEK